MQSDEAERGTVQSIATSSSLLRFRLGYGHAPRSKVVKWWEQFPPNRVHFVTFGSGEEYGSADQSQLGYTAAAGVQAPEIHGQMSRHRDDGFFALGTGGPGTFAQHIEALFYRWILWLETDQSPGALDQCGS